MSSILFMRYLLINSFIIIIWFFTTSFVLIPRISTAPIVVITPVLFVLSLPSARFGFDGIVLELIPQRIKFFNVFIDVVLAIHHYDIFLITFSRLESPVEWSRHQEQFVYNHKLVMHMVPLLRINSAGDSVVGHPLSVCSFVFHSFVVCNDTDWDSSIVRGQYFSGKIIIWKWENAKVDWLCSFWDILR